MANPLEGTAHFTFDGREYLLVLDNRVWIEAEDVLGGESILDAIEQLRAALAMGKNPMLRTMLAIIYGGLKAHQPDITQDDVVKFFFDQGEQGAEFKAAVLKAMRGAQMPDTPPPPKPAVEAGNALATAKARKRQKAGTGK